MGSSQTEQPPLEARHDAVPLPATAAVDLNHAVPDAAVLETVPEIERRQPQSHAEPLPGPAFDVEKLVEPALMELSPGSRRRLDFSCPIRMQQPAGVMHPVLQA